MKNSEILRRARTYIESGETSYICRALATTYAASPWEVAWHPYIALEKWVMSLLGRCYTYNEWLEKHHPKRYESLGGLTFAEKQLALRPGRLAWTDWMIKYWEEKGE